MEFNYINSKDILKNNKFLTFFYNYDAYKFAPANFIRICDADSFNVKNIKCWLRHIDKKLKSLQSDVFCYYMLQNGIKITINYPGQYNTIMKQMLEYDSYQKQKYRYVFFWMMNICFKYKINMLDTFIFIFYNCNESEDCKIEGYDKIIDDCIQNIYNPVDNNTKHWFNEIFNDMDKALQYSECDNFIFVNNLLCNKSEKKLWNTVYCATDSERDKVRRALNNFISIIIIMLLQNGTLKSHSNHYKYIIHELNYNILNKVFYILNKANANIFSDFIYLLYSSAYKYFNGDVNTLFVYIISESNYYGIDTEEKDVLNDIKRYIENRYNDYIKNKQYKQPANKTLSKQKDTDKEYNYYIERDEFNGSNKRTYKLLYKFNIVDNVSTNIFVMKQVDGNKFGQKYILNKYDCKKLNIKYEPDLEVFSSELKWIKEPVKK